MKGLKKAAALANGRSRACGSCPLNQKGNIRCTPEIASVCSKAFREGFEKGAKWSNNKINGGQQK